MAKTTEKVMINLDELKCISPHNRRVMGGDELFITYKVDGEDGDNRYPPGDVIHLRQGQSWYLNKSIEFSDSLEVTLWDYSDHSDGYNLGSTTFRPGDDLRTFIFEGHDSGEGHDWEYELETRWDFTIDPDNLTINDVFLTGNDYKNARIFANGVMQARLILKYSYDYAPEYFPGASQDGIEEVIIPKVNSYLQDPTNLRIYLQGDDNQDIIDKGWDREYESNGYLHDLDRPSKNLQQEESSNTKIIQDGLKPDPIHSEYAIYITPPTNVPLTYDLLVKLIHKNEPANNPVTLNTKLFEVSQNDIDFRQISAEDYDDSCYVKLLALKYNYNNPIYGAATLNHIDQDEYFGLLASEEMNVCLAYLNGHEMLGIIYYPTLADGGIGNPITPFKTDVTYNTSAAPIFERVSTPGGPLIPPYYFRTNANKDLDKLSNVFDENEVQKAHNAGIMLIEQRMSTYLLEASQYTSFSLSSYPMYMYPESEVSLRIRDNCGNFTQVTFAKTSGLFSDPDYWNIINAYPA